MLWGAFEGSELELRASPKGGRVIRGRFPYGKKATLSAGGRGKKPRKEVFKPGAFTYSLTDPKAPDIHLLAGHDFDKPLARKSDGSLTFSDSREALSFTGYVSAAIAATSFALDLFALIEAGMVAGISPGFRIPPPEAVPNAEEVIEEDPSEGDALIRVINEALLFELSAVTRPAYGETSVDLRSWNLTRRIEAPDAGLRRALERWRA